MEKQSNTALVYERLRELEEALYNEKASLVSTKSGVPYVTVMDGRFNIFFFFTSLCYKVHDESKKKDKTRTFMLLSDVVDFCRAT